MVLPWSCGAVVLLWRFGVVVLPWSYCVEVLPWRMIGIWVRRQRRWRRMIVEQFLTAPCRRLDVVSWGLRPGHERHLRLGIVIRLLLLWRFGVVVLTWSYFGVVWPWSCGAGMLPWGCGIAVLPWSCGVVVLLWRFGVVMLPWECYALLAHRCDFMCRVPGIHPLVALRRGQVQVQSERMDVDMTFMKHPLPPSCFFEATA